MNSKLSKPEKSYRDRNGGGFTVAAKENHILIGVPGDLSGGSTIKGTKAVRERAHGTTTARTVEAVHGDDTSRKTTFGSVLSSGPHYEPGLMWH